MPRPRAPENKGLPLRWRHVHGAYYYQVPLGLEPSWDNKKTFRLGKTLTEAYKTWAEKLDSHGNVTLIGELLDRYALDVIPKKKPASRRRELAHIRRLRLVFGAMPLLALQPNHIYKYVDKRRKKTANEAGKLIGGATTARKEVGLLSHAYTKAVEWGYINKHPFKGEVRLEGDKARTRYIEDWELIECLALPSKRSRGSIIAIQAYIRLKMLTGLRAGDLLRLKEAALRDDGIHVGTSKTGKPVIYDWSDELRQAITLVKAARPVHISQFIFCNKYGQGYFDEETGEASGWNSMWQRFMSRLLKETTITERFTEHDLRAKCASDAETLEHARALLAHADSNTTRKIYRRKPERVKPLR